MLNGIWALSSFKIFLKALDQNKNFRYLSIRMSKLFWFIPFSIIFSSRQIENALAAFFPKAGGCGGIYEAAISMD